MKPRYRGTVLEINFGETKKDDISVRLKIYEDCDGFKRKLRINENPDFAGCNDNDASGSVPPPSTCRIAWPGVPEFYRKVDACEPVPRTRWLENAEHCRSTALSD